ncbi:virion structural protein [Pseudomonas phage PhiPA3]|uniref:Virion structural protein n=1 Tax=Pseudomonas phage PhiPA3 TaxID=998086 RepID=F8SK25_BPPA3|nr:virion structural protein [Pseudomonas phage PhiPA3]AEH03575.1 virion structural protein [Pseudomonas phage PhiPA3]
MTDTYVSLPLDKTGRDPNNLMGSEEHTLVATPNFPYKIITLYHGGFYLRDLRVYDAQYKRLVKDVDYIVTYYHKDASEYIGLDICSAIVFLDKTRTGKVYTSAQMVGGDLAFSFTVVNDYVQFYRSKPANYIPVSKDYNGNEPIWKPGELEAERWHLDTYQPFNNELDRIARAITGSIGDYETDYHNNVVSAYNQFMARFDNRLDNHINDKNNPHQDNKSQTEIGLPRLQNFKVATQAEANAAASNTLYLTPKLSAGIVTTLALTPLNNHINSTGNVHRVTLAQLNTPSKDTVDATVNTKYLRNETVEGANLGLFNGGYRDWNYMSTEFRRNIPAQNFVAGGANGYMPPRRIGRGNPDGNSAMHSDGSWWSWPAIFARYGTTTRSAVYIMTMGNVTPAQAHAIATSQSFAYTAPIGSIIFYNLNETLTWGRGNGTFTETHVQTFGSMKTASGWVQL